MTTPAANAVDTVVLRDGYKPPAAQWTNPMLCLHCNCLFRTRAETLRTTGNDYYDSAYAICPNVHCQHWVWVKKPSLLERLALWWLTF